MIKIEHPQHGRMHVLPADLAAHQAIGWVICPPKIGFCERIAQEMAAPPKSRGRPKKVTNGADDVHRA